MSVAVPTTDPTTDIDARVGRVEWSSVSAALDAHGWAMLERVLTPAECDGVAQLYDDDARFRSHIVMARHGFGRGDVQGTSLTRCRTSSDDCARPCTHGSRQSPTVGTSRWA